MNIFKAYKKWKQKIRMSDIRKIEIYSSVSFGMSSKYLFDDVEETKIYVKTLNKILK